ncbi:MAG: hypothetical protein LBQ19_04460, partial [Synergistaceae bacterium]|nr:hypothetical protein [Synergistaceae bacterium]
MREDFTSIRQLRDYQLERLNGAVRLAAGRSRFYAKRLSGVSLRLEKLEDVERLPFTDENDLMGGI